MRKFEESQQESGPLSADAVASYVVPIAFAAVMAFVVIGVLGYRRIAGKALPLFCHRVNHQPYSHNCRCTNPVSISALREAPGECKAAETEV